MAGGHCAVWGRAMGSQQRISSHTSAMLMLAGSASLRAPDGSANPSCRRHLVCTRYVRGTWPGSAQVDDVSHHLQFAVELLRAGPDVGWVACGAPARPTVRYTVLSSPARPLGLSPRRRATWIRMAISSRARFCCACVEALALGFERIAGRLIFEPTASLCSRACARTQLGPTASHRLDSLQAACRSLNRKG